MISFFSTVLFDGFTVFRFFTEIATNNVLRFWGSMYCSIFLQVPLSGCFFFHIRGIFKSLKPGHPCLFISESVHIKDQGHGRLPGICVDMQRLLEFWVALKDNKVVSVLFIKGPFHIGIWREIFALGYCVSRESPNFLGEVRRYMPGRILEAKMREGHRGLLQKYFLIIPLLWASEIIPCSSVRMHMIGPSLPICTSSENNHSLYQGRDATEGGLGGRPAEREVSEGGVPYTDFKSINLLSTCLSPTAAVAPGVCKGWAASEWSGKNQVLFYSLPISRNWVVTPSIAGSQLIGSVFPNTSYNSLSHWVLSSWVWRKGKLNMCSESSIFNQTAMIRSSLWLIIDTFWNGIVLIKTSELKSVWNPTKMGVKTWCVNVCLCFHMNPRVQRKGEEVMTPLHPLISWDTRIWKRGGKC